MTTIAIINLSDEKNEEIKEYSDKIVELTGWNIRDYYYKCQSSDEKIENLIKIYKDNDVGYIFVLWGGTSTINLLHKKRMDRLFNEIKKTDKLLIGNSDIDHLNLSLINKDFKSINGYCLKDLCKYKSLEDLNQLKSIIENKDYDIKIINSKNSKFLSGKVIATNLQVLCLMLKNLDEDMFKDKILFLEDHNNDEKMVKYYLDYLRSSGIFEKVKGLVIGSLEKTGVKENILDYLKDNSQLPIFDISKWAYIKNGSYCKINLNYLTITQNEIN
jgi:muramoyltetrapeptide carboxypeptidase